MKPFAYERATTREQAIAAAASGARFLAGGTTLVDLMREGVEQPSKLVDINRLPLRDIDVRDGALHIGALARMADVAAHAGAARAQPLIVEALLEGASPQLRNMASIGGNLLQRVRCPYFRALDAPCNKRQPGSGCAALDGAHRMHAIFGGSERCFATHPSDLAVALVAMDASVVIEGPGGRRRIPVESLYRLPGDTPHLEHELRSGELIVAVDVPAFEAATKYLKVRDRASYEFALVSVAAAVRIRDGRVDALRLAAGGIGTKPWRLREAEQAVVGGPATDEAWRRAGEVAARGAAPRRDNGYKVELLRRTVARALAMAGETA